MFIRGMPIKIGYKNYILASSDGYPYKFETFTGACKTKNSSMPLGPQVMSDLLLIVEDLACHCVYFDRFFTSHSLLRDLHKKNFRALGTIRENRTMKCLLRPSKAVDKENTVDFLTTTQVTTCPQCNGRTTRLFTWVQISATLSQPKK